MCLCRRLVATRFPGGDGSCRRCDEARIESCMFLAKARSVRPSAQVPSQRSPPGRREIPVAPDSPSYAQETRTHGKDDSRDPREILLLRASSRKERKRRRAGGEVSAGGAAGMNRAARSAGASSSAPPRARRRPALRARCRLTRGARTRGGKPEKREAPPGPRRRAARRSGRATLHSCRSTSRRARRRGREGDHLVNHARMELLLLPYSRLESSAGAGGGEANAGWGGGHGSSSLAEREGRGAEARRSGAGGGRDGRALGEELGKPAGPVDVSWWGMGGEKIKIGVSPSWWG
jgi:hypothetical protein